MILYLYKFIKRLRSFADNFQLNIYFHSSDDLLRFSDSYIHID